MRQELALIHDLGNHSSGGADTSSNSDEQAWSNKMEDASSWSDAEALRLAQQVFLVEESPQVVVFAGVDHGTGCSQVAESVADMLSRNSQKSVCLVEANFRSPPALSGAGLTDALTRPEPIISFVKKLPQQDLCRLASGALASDSASLLTSYRLRERILELREAFDFVIVDAAPLSLYADALVLSQLSDGVVLVLEADVTRYEAAAVVTDRLRAAHIRILAGILNRRSFPIPQKLYNLL